MEKAKKPFTDNSITELRESSNTKTNKDPSFISRICVEPKQQKQVVQHQRLLSRSLYSLHSHGQICSFLNFKEHRVRL
ncbi:hypothetical protein ERO13_D07G017100v2 [Gossypium hirsutum]|uniref:Uncharacterized protein n=2 Tax=Gossypium TaxID=3633 RepID=A0A5D2U4N6_GOSMU|nr:hypothetical protein ERO13_D07G017100v2 [Gossypium hirsutum]KAG4136605.1 hypothetical protein ERO13_D07G017100v2 [Gossypium hirsutum]TYH61002.1 hypothetical protein ES332_D07G019500v1 [Gossypium tomentosum]TYI71845.1 hypothetical protein E1A91_D07G018200v1 [Gossypium mustelinum]